MPGIDKFHSLSIKYQFLLVGAGLTVLLLILLGLPRLHMSKAPANLAQKNESILPLFVTELRIEPNYKSIIVTETIQIDNRNGIAKHRITRLLPNVMQFSSGDRQGVSIEVIRASRGLVDSAAFPVNYKIEKSAEGIYVRIADENSELPREKLEFVLQYRATGPILIKDHKAELRWFLNGGLNTPVATLSAIIIPPAGLSPSAIQSQAFLRISESESQGSQHRTRHNRGRDILFFRTQENLALGYSFGLSAYEEIPVQLDWRVGAI